MSKINHRFLSVLVGAKNLGLNDKPAEDLVNATFQCLGIKHKETGDWVRLVFNGKNKNYKQIWDGAVLAGLSNSPVVKAGTTSGIDEEMRITWLKEEGEPAFKSPE